MRPNVLVFAAGGRAARGAPAGQVLPVLHRERGTHGLDARARASWVWRVAPSPQPRARAWWVWRVPSSASRSRQAVGRTSKTDRMLEKQTALLPSVQMQALAGVCGADGRAGWWALALTVCAEEFDARKKHLTVRGVAGRRLCSSALARAAARAAQVIAGEGLAPEGVDAATFGWTLPADSDVPAPERTVSARGRGAAPGSWPACRLTTCGLRGRRGWHLPTQSSKRFLRCVDADPKRASVCVCACVRAR